MTRLYPGMAFTNIKNNRKTYIPYIVSCVLTICLYYIICSLAGNEGLGALWGGDIIQTYMGMGQFIVALFAILFLFYVNSFLMKRRKSEFGLYNILGMEKRHIARIILYETFYVFLISMLLGLFFGIVLDKLMYLILLRLFDAAIPMGFYISGSGIARSAVLFGAIFLLILLNSFRQIYKARPVELLKSSDAGEREPKARWILAALGLICLLTGYFIAVTTENPVAAFAMFFIAVILVIIGTYLLFTAGSVALLKLLRKKKGYYYKTNHFISVSGMMYRMKRNAVGLANICILSTMVLVMISTTLSMYLGVDDSLRQRYPSELSITATAEDPLLQDAISVLEGAMQQEGLTITGDILYRSLSISALYDKDSNRFETDLNVYNDLSALTSYNRLRSLVFVPLEDYNRSMGAQESLQQDEILVYSNRMPLEGDTLKLFQQEFKVKKTLDSFPKSGNAAANITSSHFVVVKDMSVLQQLHREAEQAYGKYANYIAANYMADVAGDHEQNKPAILRAYEKTCDSMNSSEFDGFTGVMECRSLQEDTFGTDFAGLFFLGIFLGFLFIMATVLIMYYKQITEGYEDKKRFEIMQNVGMSHKEVRQAIRSQILIVFFLPLVAAGIHIAFAFPFFYRIMMLMNLFNLGLFAACTVGCFLAFALFYTIVYILTARLYYSIVKK